ncbi:MAG: hypothetical protein IPI46_01285 [Bacteroidetes bacterium]|nr:hypothetical protein [Bacteroidota bacterium]
MVLTILMDLDLSNRCMWLTTPQLKHTYTWTEDLTAPVIATTATSGPLGCNPTVVAPSFTGNDNCEGAITPVAATCTPTIVVMVLHNLMGCKLYRCMW